MSRTERSITRVLAGTAAMLLIAACGSRQPPDRASVEYRGTDPAGATAPSGGGQSASGIVAYEGYHAAVAREGDTVASVANRIGLSPSELGAYNGLPPDHALRPGDELVLPPRPGGYGGRADRAAPQEPEQTRLAERQTQTTPGAGTESGSAWESASGTGSGIEAAPLEATPTESERQSGTADAADGWSPDLAAAAIERAESGEQAGVGVPPSAGEPLPPDPEPAEELDSPQLGQYQTPRTEDTGRVPAPRPVETITTPAEQPPEAEETETEPAETESGQTEMAAASPAPERLSLIRPATGPVVVGFQQGAGRVRNDGVDFASPVGSPVVAAADGEVALVSQSLGGLGTIVLLRHPGDYLTVYGRIDNVRVQKGDIVSQGQEIGVVASNPQPRMHFEVRKGAESLDPERFFTGAS